MSMNRPGVGNAAAFQVSGWPWITGSYITASSGYVKVELPSVAKSITVINQDAMNVWPFNLTGSCSIVVFFGPDLTGAYPPFQVTKNHCITIPNASGSFRFETKHTQFFVGKKSAAHFGAFQVFAELTNCEMSDLYQGTTRDGVLTGSGVTE